MTTTVTLIVLAGLSGAMVLATAYWSGARLSGYTKPRFVASYFGFVLVTTGVPLAVYFFPDRGWTLWKLVLALAIFASLALLVGLPRDEEGS